MKIKFTNTARKEIYRLDIAIQRRIGRKLKWLASQINPLDFADPLREHDTGQYRFRIGSYRVIFDIEREWITVHSVGHRREIYKK